MSTMSTNFFQLYCHCEFFEFIEQQSDMILYNTQGNTGVKNRLFHMCIYKSKWVGIMLMNMESI